MNANTPNMLTFVPANEVSEEAKAKLNMMKARKKDRLNKLVEDYKAGKIVIPQ